MLRCEFLSKGWDPLFGVCLSFFEIYKTIHGSECRGLAVSGRLRFVTDTMCLAYSLRFRREIAC